MIFGYASSIVGEHGLLQMKELTIAVRPEVLRQIARFLDETASELENAASESWHRHCDDELSRAVGCEIIVGSYKPHRSRGK
jgi:hypothetical protein